MGQEFHELINECISGSGVAQKKLYDQFSSKMYGICLQYSKNTEEASDILQDGFIKVFQKLNQFSGKGSFEGWLRRVFVNTALEKYRNKVIMLSIDDNIEIPATGAYESIISELSAMELLKMIQNLSPQYRLVFNLFAIEGYTHKEISKLLNISEGTSKSNLSRARSILQENVNKLNKREERG
ncbi:MAG: sigma-70 family RNA polymerase sigma factor [Bacteroidales bacterium]|nr:sigma-70 family RNA polymerase sigma factor [Bacteroidales bacterium]